MDFCASNHLNPHTLMKDYKKNREQKIVDLVAEGKSNVEIGKEVCLSASAVANELSNIFAEKGVKKPYGFGNADLEWKKEINNLRHYFLRRSSAFLLFILKKINNKLPNAQ